MTDHQPAAQITARHALAVAAAGAGMLAATAIAPAVAPAATVGFTVIPIEDGQLETLDYKAGGAEANRLTVSASARLVPVNQGGTVVRLYEFTFVFNDQGAIVSPRSRCARGSSPRQARCLIKERAAAFGPNIALGTGNDTATATGVMTRQFSHPMALVPSDYMITGGAGSDTLAVGAGARGFLFGGIGNDRLTGGPAGDRLVGGPGRDRIAGGPGLDTTSYADHRMPVRIDLGRGAGQGAAGENDLLSGIEVVLGGNAGDSLTGGAGRNLLYGRGGNDQINVAGGGLDSVFCGPGIDTVRADPQDRATDCERVIR